MKVDDLAQEIRRVDGNHSLGAGALAEALMPFIDAHLSQHSGGGEVVAWNGVTDAALAIEWANIHEAESRRYVVNRSFTNARRHSEIAKFLRIAALTHPRPVVPDTMVADLLKFHEETEACGEFDLTNESIAALLVANLIEGTNFVLTAKGEAALDASHTPTTNAGRG